MSGPTAPPPLITRPGSPSPERHRDTDRAVCRAARRASIRA
ncbi:hypothetical protein [Streptomyces sp. S1]